MENSVHFGPLAKVSNPTLFNINFIFKLATRSALRAVILNLKQKLNRELDTDNSIVRG